MGGRGQIDAWRLAKPVVKGRWRADSMRSSSTNPTAMKLRRPLLTLAALSAVAPAFAADLLLVTNKADQTLSLIDPAKHEQIATVPEEGVTGHEVSTSVDGKLAFVPIFGNSGVGKPGTDGELIRVIDLEQRKITGTIDFKKGVRPHCPVTNAATGLLFVTVENNNAVAVIDPKEQKILGEVPTGEPESHMLAVTRDGKRGFTANVGPGTVSVLDLANRKLTKVIPVCKRVQRIALSVDERFAFTSDQFVPQLGVIDTQTLEVSHWIPMPGCGYGSAPTPDGKYLVIALSVDNKVALIDLEARKTVKVVDAPKSPQEVLIRPDGEYAYVSCDASKQVMAINLKEWKVEKLIDVGNMADGLAWAAGK